MLGLPRCKSKRSTIGRRSSDSERTGTRPMMPIPRCSFSAGAVDGEMARHSHTSLVHIGGVARREIGRRRRRFCSCDCGRRNSSSMRSRCSPRGGPAIDSGATRKATAQHAPIHERCLTILPVLEMCDACNARWRREHRPDRRASRRRTLRPPCRTQPRPRIHSAPRPRVGEHSQRRFLDRRPTGIVEHDSEDRKTMLPRYGEHRALAVEIKAAVAADLDDQSASPSRCWRCGRSRRRSPPPCERRCFRADGE